MTRRLSLKVRLLAWAAPGIVVLSLGAFLLVSSLPLPVGLAQDEARSHLAHTRYLLEESSFLLGRAVLEVAAQEGTAALGDPSPLSSVGLQSICDRYRADVAVVVDPAGEVVMAQDPTGTFRPGSRVPPSLLTLAREASGVARFWRSGHHAFLLAGTSVGNRGSGGTVLVAQLLSKDYTQRLSERLGHRVELVLSNLPSSVTNAAVLTGVDGTATGAVRLDSTTRPWTGPYLMVATVGLTLIAGLLLLGWATDRVVVGPLVTLRDTVQELRWGNPVNTHLPTDRHDEVGQLAFEVAMLAGELRTSEHGRSRTEAKNRALLNAIPDMMFLLDRDGNFLDFKPSHSLDTLVPPSVFLGKNVRRFFPSDIAERTLTLIGKSLESDDTQVLEYALPDEEGIRHYEARLVACTPGEVLAIVREISERKLAEEARVRLATILDATPDLVATASEDGTLLYLNAAGQKMLGLPRPGGPPNLWTGDFLPDGSRALICDQAVPTARRDGVWSGESAFLKSDGTELPVSQVILAHRRQDQTVEYFSTIARDISSRKHLEAKLLYLADHDPLTHLFGRRRFQEELGRELARALRDHTSGALLFIDLDEFKYVNDSMGHNAGDQLLVSIARLLSARLRKTDLISRLGGDEFGILLSRADRKQAQEVASQLLEAIRQHAIMVDGQPIGITASIGIALYPGQGKTALELSARADLAMYQAKLRGRNGYVVYTPDKDWQAQVASRLSGEKRIREALEKGRFLLHAQPILDLQKNRITQYELLVRMLDDNGDVVMPGAFIGIAERFGLIHALESWVVSQAIRVLAEQSAAGRDVRLSVNLSGRSFSNTDLVTIIRRELDTASVDPSRLTFEVTETAAISDTAEALNFATALKELGCKLALDDFGVGFSSLHHLKYLPVDYLKIDGSFVRNLPRSRIDQELVKTIVDVSRALGKGTIAEFVSDQETIELLKKCGVDYAQGFHIGRPGPLSEILR